MCQSSIFASEETKNKLSENSIFVFEKGLDFRPLLWYCCVLTGGVDYEKYDKRVMARKHHTARGQQKQLEGDEGATRIHGKAYAFRRNIAMREDEICLI